MSEPHDGEESMKYLCLVYHEEGRMAALSAAVRAELMRETVEVQRQLRCNGYEIASALLQPGSAAATIRVRGTTLAISEGSVAGTQEHLGGFYLIEARDFNDALRIAARLPPARIGSVEIRPVQEPWPEANADG